MDIQGHRGARGLYPENSLLGFEKAIEMGVDTLEMDVVISKDLQVVVSHEAYFNRKICLDKNGKVIGKAQEKTYNLYEMDYEEIQQFDCGSLQHPSFPNQELSYSCKPLLSEVIAMAEEKSGASIRYNIELKSTKKGDGLFHPPPKEFAALVLQEITNITQRVILQSFDNRVLEEIYRYNPESTICILVDKHEDIEEKINQLSFKPKYVGPYYTVLDKEQVQQLHKSNYKIIPWTINEITDIEKYLLLGIDGIISDYPNRVIQIQTEKNIQ